MSGTTLAVTDATFRGLYPEFADESVYTPLQVGMWLSVATAQLTPAAWQSLLTVGVCLFTAHNLALGRRAALAAATGGVPGATGVVSSKSVGPASLGYDTSTTAEDGAGAWNLTAYGQQFYHYMQLVGMGGTQFTGLDGYVPFAWGVGGPEGPGPLFGGGVC